MDNYSLNSISKQKRGMSPLIATVLLIAFAVALGAMIMNIPWGGDIGPDCSGINLIINPYLCYADNMIKMNVKNTGRDLEAITMKVVDASGETIKPLPSSRVLGNNNFKRDIPYVKTGPKLSVSLIGSILYNEEVFPCDGPVDKPALVADEVPDCTGEE